MPAGSVHTGGGPPALFAHDRAWHEGLLELEKIEPFFSQDMDRLRDINTARALDILFDSCCNILRFYQLREALADLTGQPGVACLEQQRQLIQKEIGTQGKRCRLLPAGSSVGLQLRA
jgi:hypothetical protein